MEIDLTQALKDTENSLRDFVAAILEKEIGTNWMDNCGVTPDRIQKWQERKILEEKRQTGGVVEPRLVYYADFYDIKTILKKHWDKFAAVFGEWKTMDVFLKELESLRDPDAHRRELLPHQKNLALGIGGEIRTKLIRYRSKMETTQDFFPRIESARDSLGNIWTTGMSVTNAINTGQILRPGDVVEYVITASDPMGEELQFQMIFGYAPESTRWQRENTFSLKILDGHVTAHFPVILKIKSPRKHHASGESDDWVHFYYSVLPKR